MKKLKRKRKKMRHFCRLYKYVCAGPCGKNRHMRHSIVAGQICPQCARLIPNENQPSLFYENDPTPAA